MARMRLKLGPGTKQKLRRMRRETKEKGLSVRCQIVLLAGKGWIQRQIGEALGVSRSCVSRVLSRYRVWGIAGLYDRREDNGRPKVDEDFLEILRELLYQTPYKYGYRRPTWTRELLVLVMEKRTGIRVHVGTMSRALAKIGARRGRPKPVVRCPWPKRRRQRRLAQLRRLLEGLGEGELAYYEDEVDIQLNPKLGLDWMNRGDRKYVVTPGQNEKCYLAGAMDSRTGKLIWVGGMRKNSLLFIDLVEELVRRHREASVIHIILDNYKIHKSKQTKAVIRRYGGRVKLHFLPPYCPDENRIERVWKDLHDNVTRNHRCSSLRELAQEVVQYLRDRNRRGPQPLSKVAA